MLWKTVITFERKKAIKIISYCSDVLQPGHLLTMGRNRSFYPWDWIILSLGPIGSK